MIVACFFNEAPLCYETIRAAILSVNPGEIEGPVLEMTRAISLPVTSMQIQP